MLDTLSEYQRDALVELWNMAINQAAGRLSELVGRTVELSIPHLRLLDLEGLRRFLDEEIRPGAPCINQGFEGDFAGNALLIYPRSSAVRLASVLLGDDRAVEELSSADQSALIEVGNIMLNSCIGAIGEVLGLPVVFHLPDMVLPARDIIGNVLGGAHWRVPAADADTAVAFLLESEMVVEGADIAGYIAIAMGGDTAALLVEHMEQRWLA